MAKRERLTSVGSKQILLKLPEGMYSEIMRLVDEKKIEEAISRGGYRSRQEFILEAVRRSLKRERI